MAEDAQQNQGRWLWWLAAGAAAVVVLAAAGAGWYYYAGGKVWTDGSALKRPDHLVRVREVIWTAPRALGQAVNTDRQEYEPCLSPDGEELYFVRGLPGEGADIYVCRREETGWGEPRLLAAVNTEHDELGPRLSPDGRFLLLYSDRPGGLGQYDLWAAARTKDGWSAPLNLGPAVNSKYNDYSPALTPDGKRLIFATNREAAAKEQVRGTPWRATIRQGRLGDYDLFAAERADANAPASAPASAPTAAAGLAFRPATRLEGVNTPHHEGACCVSPAGDFLYFTSNRPGGRGGFDLYRCRLSDGRCGEVTSVGPEINTSANEMEPHLADGGFRLVFSSDRPKGRGGYDLFTAESREVYAIRGRRAPPQLAWSWWALIAALALLVPLLLFLRAAGYKHLSLLQKCIAISLLLHIGMTMLMSLFFIYKPLLHHVAEAAGLTTAVNLEQAEEVQMRMQIRQQITDLPVSELPVRDPALAELIRPRPTAIAPAAPQQARLNVPRAEVRPVPLTVQPEAPRLIKPATSAEPVSLPQPPVRSDTPTLRLSPEAPIVEAEHRLQPRPEAPAVAERTPARTEAPTVAPEAVRLAAAALRPETESLAEVPAAERPALPDAERIAAAPSPPIRTELAVDVPRTPARRISATPATAPAAPALHAAATQATTASPRGQASLALLAVPTAEKVGDSIAVVAAVSHPPRGTGAPVAVDIAAATDGPEIKLPALASPKAATGAEPRVPATAVRPPGDLEARSLVSAAPSAAAPRAATALASVSPARLNAASLIRPALASLGRPTDAKPTTDRLAPTAMLTPLMPLAPVGKSASPDAFFQRSFEQRQKFIDDMGGSKETEAAVARALAYLARTQEKDGHWPFRPGQKDSGRRGKNDIAITGLAALCFLAADHTPTKQGPYQQAVRKAIDYICARQKDDGDLRFGGDMYSQAIAALAVGEAAAMTGEPYYKAAAIKAARFIINAQNRRTGGWRYQPGDPGDTSVFGWQVMALHSIEEAGVKIPAETRRLAFRWLDFASKPPHRVLAGYQNASPRKAMTAEALFSRILLGQELTDEQIREACDYIDFPGETDRMYYYWYYASLALMQLQNDAWRRWNPRVRDTLVRYQQRDGSWDEKRASRYGRRGGRIYATALSTLTLEVYYRYLPMYRVPGGQRP